MWPTANCFRFAEHGEMIAMQTASNLFLNYHRMNTIYNIQRKIVSHFNFGLLRKNLKYGDGNICGPILFLFSLLASCRKQMKCDKTTETFCRWCMFICLGVPDAFYNWIMELVALFFVYASLALTFAFQIKPSSIKCAAECERIYFNNAYPQIDMRITVWLHGNIAQTKKNKNT